MIFDNLTTTAEKIKMVQGLSDNDFLSILYKTLHDAFHLTQIEEISEADNLYKFMLAACTESQFYFYIKKIFEDGNLELNELEPLIKGILQDKKDFSKELLGISDIREPTESEIAATAGKLFFESEMEKKQRELFPRGDLANRA